VNPAKIIEHFDRVSEAPDAIPQLRQLILDLAVRGKLVEQTAGDPPASDTLGDRVLSLAVTESPWQLPIGWSWSSLALLGESIGGGTPSKDNPELWSGQIPWVSPKDMKIDFISDSEDHITEEAIAQSAVRLIPAGALLIVVRGMILAHSFPTAITTVPVTINQDMKAVVPFRSDMGRILLLLTKGMKPIILRLVRRSTHGTCKLLTADLFGSPIPIPPLPEQGRINAKVEELMALCDRLEAAQKERELRRNRLAASSLNRLNRPSIDAAVFRQHARFQLDHLQRLVTQNRHVLQLRQTILNLAVRGQLVSQDPNDEPAADVIKCSRAEKMRLVSEGKIKKPQLTSTIAGIEGPFQLSRGWTWGRIEDLFTSVTDGDHLPPPKTSTGVPFLVIGNVRNQQVDFSGCRHVSEDYYKALDDIRRPQKGDVLYTLVGSYGIAILVTENRPFCVQRHIGILRPSKCIDTAFVVRALESQLVFDQATECATGIAQKTVPLSGLRRMLIPVPPRSEQHRIVAAVDELMGVCDQLETQLTTAHTESRRFLKAILHETVVSQQRPIVAAEIEST
jgi:type I restriction enzyme, S subunit